MRKKSPQLNKALVAFIDILGFRTRLRNIVAQSDLDTIYNQLLTIQNEFEKNPSKTQKEDQDYAAKTVLAFSDCIVISLEMKSKYIKKFGSFDPLLWEIDGIGLRQAICVCNNIFLRGCISIGTWYRDKDIIISPALAEAYDIESKCAIEPIIVISEKTYNFFKTHPHRNWYAPEIDPVDSLFRKYKRDRNTLYFLDYLRIGFDGAADWHTQQDLESYRAAHDDEEKNRILCASYAETQKDFLHYHKAAVTKGFIESPADRIRSKYKWLFKYHNQFVSGLSSYFYECLVDAAQYQ